MRLYRLDCVNRQRRVPIDRYRTFDPPRQVCPAENPYRGHLPLVIVRGFGLGY